MRIYRGYIGLYRLIFPNNVVVSMFFAFPSFTQTYQQVSSCMPAKGLWRRLLREAPCRVMKPRAGFWGKAE